MQQKPVILLTGGGGYIGSHIALSLLLAGYRVVIVDNWCNSDPSVVSRILEIAQHENASIQASDLDTVVVNLAGERASQLSTSMHMLAPLRAAFQVYSISAVIHLAALKSVPESIDDPLSYYHNNIGSLVNVLDVMDANNVHKLVFSSSATVYGASDKTFPLTEEKTGVPTNPYGRTKLYGEQICEDVWRMWKKKDPSGSSVFCARYANPVASHPSGLLKEQPVGPAANLFAVINEVIDGKRKKLSVFGGDYGTRDGSCIRDFVHVLDVAEAHVAMIKKMVPLTPIPSSESLRYFYIFNVGTGIGTTVFEMLREIEKQRSVTVPFEVVERRAGDVQQLVEDVSLIERVLGWKAKRTLVDMCAKSRL